MTAYRAGADGIFAFAHTKGKQCLVCFRACGDPFDNALFVGVETYLQNNNHKYTKGINWKNKNGMY